MVDKGAGHDDRARASIIEHQHRTNVPNPGAEHEVNIPPIGTPARMQHARNSPKIRTKNRGPIVCTAFEEQFLP